jgi:hypothetical protein
MWSLSGSAWILSGIHTGSDKKKIEKKMYALLPSMGVDPDTQKKESPLHLMQGGGGSPINH